MSRVAIWLELAAFLHIIHTMSSHARGSCSPAMCSICSCHNFIAFLYYLYRRNAGEAYMKTTINIAIV